MTPGGSQRELVQPNAVGGADEGETVGLKKRVGLVSGIALIVGTMIGSSLFCNYSFDFEKHRGEGGPHSQ